MKIHILRHDDIVGPGLITEWAKGRGHLVTVTHAHRGEPYPALSDFDLLIILGGLATAYDEETYPWLKEEKAWISTVIQNEKHVLGICLGAQLIADVMGGRAIQHTEKEIGWWPVTFNKEAQSNPLLHGVPSEAVFFEYHQDNFIIPPTGTHLATSEGCHHQAFSIGDTVLATQFHPEMSEEALPFLLEETSSFIEEGPFVQDIESMLLHDSFQESKRHFYTILDNFEKQIYACSQGLSTPEATTDTIFY